jgi:hypothetical protein
MARRVDPDEEDIIWKRLLGGSTKNIAVSRYEIYVKCRARTHHPGIPKNAVKKLVSQELDPSKSFASQRVGAIRVVHNLVSIAVYHRFFNILTI